MLICNLTFHNSNNNINNNNINQGGVVFGLGFGLLIAIEKCVTFFGACFIAPSTLALTVVDILKTAIAAHAVFVQIRLNPMLIC